MKIQISTSNWRRDNLIPPQTYDVETICELKEAAKEVVRSLYKERDNLNYFQTGFDPKSNVNYKLTNSDFSSIKLTHKRLFALSEDNTLSWLFE